MKHYEIDQILLMSAQEFSDKFLRKNVSVTFYDKGKKKCCQGIVGQVGLAVNKNPDNGENLPCDISIANKTIRLDRIITIEL